MKRVLRRFLSLFTRRDDVELYVIEEVAISVLVVPLVIVLVSIAACAVPAWPAAHQSD